MDNATRAIVKLVAAEWTDTPVAYPAMQFTPPAAGPWARLTVQWGDAFMRTLDGGNTVRGVLFFDVFTKPGVGEGDGLALASKARGMFNRRDVPVAWPATGSVLFEAASGPRTDDGREGWLQHQVRVPFSFDERVQP